MNGWMAVWGGLGHVGGSMDGRMERPGARVWSSRPPPRQLRMIRRGLAQAQLPLPSSIASAAAARAPSGERGGGGKGGGLGDSRPPKSPSVSAIPPRCRERGGLETPPPPAPPAPAPPPPPPQLPLLSPPLTTAPPPLRRFSFFSSAAFCAAVTASDIAVSVALRNFAKSLLLVITGAPLTFKPTRRRCRSPRGACTRARQSSILRSDAARCRHPHPLNRGEIAPPPHARCIPRC